MWVAGINSGGDRRESRYDAIQVMYQSSRNILRGFLIDGFVESVPFADRFEFLSADPSGRSISEKLPIENKIDVL